MIKVIVLSLLIATPAWAQPCTEQDYTSGKAPNYNCPGPDEAAVIPQIPHAEKSIGIKKDAPAKFKGLLMPKEQVINLGIKIKGLRRLRFIDMKQAKEKLKIEIKFEKANAAADLGLVESQRDNYKRQALDLKADLIDANKWYRSWCDLLELSGTPTLRP